MLKKVYEIISSSGFNKLCRTLAITEMIVIFILSGMTGSLSHAISNIPAMWMGLEETHIVTDEGEAIGIDASSQDIVGGLSLRKLAHIAMYGVLGGLVFFSISVKKRNEVRLILSIIICYIYALGDEFHQYFVPGRGCHLTDTFVDAIGFIIASLICWGVCFLLESYQKE